nr:MAG TPA: hypothetical protein [Caudoviricetes sp.]
MIDLEARLYLHNINLLLYLVNLQNKVLYFYKKYLDLRYKFELIHFYYYILYHNQ